MDAPLFRVQGQDTLSQRRYLSEQQGSRAEFERADNPRGSWENGNETFNITNPGSKVTAQTFTMTLADYHKLFLGRIPEAGNETEVRELVRRMCEELHRKYPDVIQSPEWYEKAGNGVKYAGSAPPRAETEQGELQRQLIRDGGGRIAPSGEVTRPGVAVVSDTQLAPGAKGLFNDLNIDTAASEADQLAEFRSRLTYLAFQEKKGSSREYLRKMIQEHQHLSVTSATRLGVLLSGVDDATAQMLQSKAAALGGSSHAIIRIADGQSSSVVVNLDVKSYKKLLNDLSAARDRNPRLGQVVDAISQELHKRFPLVIAAPAPR